MLPEISFSDATEVGVEHSGSAPGSSSGWKNLPGAAVDIAPSFQANSLSYKGQSYKASFADGHKLPCCALLVPESMILTELPDHLHKYILRTGASFNSVIGQ